MTSTLNGLGMPSRRPIGSDGSSGRMRKSQGFLRCQRDLDICIYIIKIHIYVNTYILYNKYYIMYYIIYYIILSFSLSHTHTNIVIYNEQKVY